MSSKEEYLRGQRSGGKPCRRQSKKPYLNPLLFLSAVEKAILKTRGVEKKVFYGQSHKFF